MENHIVIKMGAEGFHASRSGVRGFFQDLREVPKREIRKHSSWLASEAGIEGHLRTESRAPMKKKKGARKYGRRPPHD